MKSLRNVGKLASLAAILVLVLLFSVACGTVDINLHTTVNNGGDITQKITLSATGALGTSMGDSTSSSDLKQEGWDVTTSQDGDKYTIEATKNFAKDEPLSWGSTSGDPMNLNNTKFTQDNSLFFRTYHFETTLQGTPDLSQAAGSTSGSLDLNSQQVEALISSMFSMSWSISLPGSITKSNADKVEGSTGTWNLSFASLQTDRSILIESRVMNWPVIGGIIAAVVLILAVVVFLVVRSRRPQYTLPPPPPGQPLAP
jgi:hypothetical protein